MHARLTRLPLFALVLTALACATFGGASQTPTPAAKPALTAASPTGATLAPQVTATTPGASPATPTAPGVNLSNSGTADTPRLAYDAQGTLHLAWYDKSAREAGDYFHRQQAANGDWSKAENLTADFEILYGDLDLIRDSGGRMCVVFAAAKASGDPSTDGLYQRCQAGATWATAEKLAVTKQTGVTVRGYSVVRAADGTAQAMHIAGAGTIYFDDTQLSGADTASSPALTIDKAGGYHAAWANLGSPFSIQYRFSSDQGKTWQAAQTLSTDQNAPDGGAVSLVADVLGNVHLLWGGGDMYYRRWTPAGGWGPTAALAGDHIGPDPNLTVDGQGLARAVWDSHGGVAYVVQTADGKWSAARLLFIAESGAPRIAVDAQGSNHIAWLANTDVFYLALP